MVGMSIGMVTFSRSAQGRHQNRWVKPLVWWAVLLTVIAALSLYLLAPLLIPLVYGAEFQESVRIIQILVFGAAFVSMSEVLGGLLRGRGRPGTVAIAEVAGGFATVLGIILFGTSRIDYVAYSAVAGFALTLIIEIVVLAMGRFPSESDPSLAHGDATS